MYDLSKLNKQGEDTKEWFKKEISSLRTGRATPALVDGVVVSSYGARTPLKQLASIGVEDAKTIRITPWDTSVLKDIEQAISASDLGAQPIADKQSIRITLPELTEERRTVLTKLLSEKLEKAKITLRQERDVIWKDVQEKERAGEISEDEKFRLKDELQKIIDTASKDLDEIAGAKKKEIAS